jgi:tetratricopeptide (TPR) repeat protein
VWRRLAVVACLLACRGAARSDLAACKEASHTGSPDAIVICGVAYADGANAEGGGLYARALVDAGGQLADVRLVAERVGDRPGGAEAWNAVGDALRAADDPTHAIEAYKRALDHRAPEDLRGRVRDAVGLFHQYAAVDDYRRAMRYAGMAYELVSRDDKRDLKSYVLMAIAGMLFDLGALPAVEALVVEADRVIDEDSAFFPHLRRLHGEIDVIHGRYELARQELTHARDLAARKQLPAIERNATLSLVEIALAQGRIDDAAEVLASDDVSAKDSIDDRTHHAYTAVTVAVAAGDLDRAIELATTALTEAPEPWVGTLEALRGRAYARAGRWKQAETSLLVAIASVEKRRADLDVDALKPWVLRREWHWPFEDLFMVYARQGRRADAFDLVQRATARSVLDGLLREDSGRLGTVDSELDRAGERMAGLRALTHSLRGSAPVEPPRMGDIVRDLGSRTVLTYFQSNGELWLVAVVGGRPILLRIGASTELARLVDAMIARPEDPAAAEQLAQRLLPESVVPGRDETIYVVPDDPILEVPFAALRVSGERLVERNPVAYVPSAAVLARIVSSSALGDDRKVIIGDPLGDLAGARTEAFAVATKIDATALVGAQATADALFASAHPDLLHIAAHTERGGMGPVLKLAGGGVTAGDIIDRGIAARVVVLTSCAAADPRDRDELGPLAMAFLAAGSRAVVAARWSVDDDVARSFARAFYEADGLRDPVLGTARAQRELLRAGMPVASWATFVVLGEGVMRTTKGK